MRKHNVHRVRKSAAASPIMPLQWRTVILTLLCACVLAAGFFYAARQHFSTIDLGLKNSKLRKQIDDLESERRRLVLAKEVSLSPVVEFARNTHPPRLQEQPPVEPQAQETTQETAKIEKKEVSPNPAPEPVQISMREAKKAPPADTKPGETKKVTKPRSEQATQKPSNPNERPRVIAESEKRVASATVKSF
jgi:outer membrane biosynthesis protein TonB